MNIEEYLEGHRLYGDNFSLEETIKWYKGEEEGYANTKDIDNYSYPYSKQNILWGFNYVNSNTKLDKVLSFGGAYGHELIPIINKTEEIYVIEPSEQLRSESLQGKKINYSKPSITGEIPYPSNYFDLITCFGVLHHISNVSFVFSELQRVLKPGGILLVREPIVSMGDWRKKRGNLTKNERGIPLHHFRKMINDLSFEIISEKLIGVQAFKRIWSKFFKSSIFNSTILLRIDNILANLLFFNYSYHAKNNFKKVRPSAIFYALKKKS